MPTWEQIEDCNAAERAMGITPQHGFGSEHPDHIPTSSAAFDRPFTGESIGFIRYDPERKDLRIFTWYEALKDMGIILPPDMPVQKCLPAPRLQ